MTSLLDRKLKQKIAAAFKGKLTKATLRRETSQGLDSFGDQMASVVTTYACEGIRESFSAFYKAQAGIPDTDVRILILLGSVKPETVPVKDDKVYLKTPWNKWYQVRRVLEIDPAGASIKLQAYEVPAPE